MKKIINDNENRFYELYSDIKQIISMGFSFNDIDMPYIDKIAKVNKNLANTKWDLYWHSNKEDKWIINKLEELGISKNNMKLIHW